MKFGETAGCASTIISWGRNPGGDRKNEQSRGRGSNDDVSSDRALHSLKKSLEKRKTRGVLYLGRFVLSASFSRAGWWVFLYLFSSSKRKTHFPVSSFTGNVPQGPVPRNCTKLKPTHSFQSSSAYRNLSMLLRTFQTLWQHCRRTRKR